VTTPPLSGVIIPTTIDTRGWIRSGALERHGYWMRRPKAQRKRQVKGIRDDKLLHPMWCGSHGWG